MHRWSRYCLSILSGGAHWLFSTRTGAVGKIPSLEIAGMSEDAASFMQEQGFLAGEEPAEEVRPILERYRNFQFAAGPLFVTIAPTLGCNFGCFYCFEKKTDLFKKRNVITKEAAQGTVDYIASNLPGRTELEVRWFGGEPLLAMERIEQIQGKLNELCDLAGISAKGLIQTNGSLLTPAVLSRLLDLRINDIHITLDGGPADHNKIRYSSDLPDSFETILENIRSALGSCSARLRVRFNVTAQNEESTETAIRMLANIDDDRALSIYFSPVYSHFNGIERRGRHAITYVSMADFADREMHLLRMLDTLKYPFDWSFLDPRCLPCSAVKADGIMIGPNGEIVKCDHDFGVPGRELGHVETGITQSRQFGEWLSVHPKDNKHCPECVLLPSCMGHCASIRNFMSEPSEACPSKKFNYIDRMRLGVESLKGISPICKHGEFSLYRGSRLLPLPCDCQL